MLRIFLDANVYFAGCASSSGASALILQLARRRRIQLVASRLVLKEAERNLRRKSSRNSVESFHRFLKATELVMVPSPPDNILAKYETVIHPKDVPVLAAAIAAQVDCLVTLDRRHFLKDSVRAHALGTRILTPGDFLQHLLHHSAQKT